MYKFFNYYNSLCAGANSPTVFSFDPYFSAIKDMLVSELRHIVFYVEKLAALNVDMSEYRDKIIEFISVLIVNLDFRRESFFVIVEDLYNNKVNLENLYMDRCSEFNLEPEILKGNSVVLNDKDSIIKSLNEYEKNISDKNEKLPVNIKNLYEIMIHLVLNACNCLIELKIYGVDYPEAKEEVLKLFNASNFPPDDQNVWVNKIKEFSEWNYLIMKKLNEVIIENYGPVLKTEAPFQMKKGKAILVSGCSFPDLKKILDAALPLNINIYTHHDMIYAFKYERLKSYPNLAGHYQRSNNNFPLDFSSFPGPIYISRNSIPKIDAIRGQIYTSAKYPSFGIAKIENNDYSPILNYALSSEGFAENAFINSLSVGFERTLADEKINEIISKFQKKEIKHIAIVGLIDKFSSSNEYINKFFKKAPDDCYIISFAYDLKRMNSWFACPYYDFSLVYYVLERLCLLVGNPADNISLFMPDCSINTISHIFNIMYLGVSKIFLGPCCPNIMNPILVDALETLFGISELSSPKEDIKTALQQKKGS